MVARARVVDQDVDVTERFDGLGRHALDVLGPGDVGRDRVQLVSCRGGLGRGLLVAFGVAAREGHTGTGLCECDRESLAQALVSAGHQRSAPAQIECRTHIHPGAPLRFGRHSGTTIDLRLAGSLSLSRASATWSRS